MAGMPEDGVSRFLLVATGVHGVPSPFDTTAGS
jgi:hypothetical protein